MIARHELETFVLLYCLYIRIRDSSIIINTNIIIVIIIIIITIPYPPTPSSSSSSHRHHQPLSSYTTLTTLTTTTHKPPFPLLKSQISTTPSPSSKQSPPSSPFHPASYKNFLFYTICPYPITSHLKWKGIVMVDGSFRVGLDWMVCIY